jgi:hypothetical protein
MIVVSRWAIALVTLAVAACSRDRGRVVGARLPVAISDGVRLIDSVAVDGEFGPRAVFGVELIGNRIDTIAGLLTTDAPTLLGDSLVLGVSAGSDGSRNGLFRYRILSRRFETLRLPTDLENGVSGVSIAPAGRWLSYVVFDSSGFAQGVIQRFPNGPILRRSPIVLVTLGNGRLSEAEWTDSTTTQLYVDAFGDGSGRWVRLRGDVLAGKWRVDTISVPGT